MTPVIVTKTDDFAQAVKEQRERLGLTHADVDHMVGWQDAYCSKVEGFDRKWGKKPFNMTYNAAELLQALGLALVVMPVSEAAEIASAGSERRIKQVARGGHKPKKEARVTCTMKRRSL